MLLVILPLTNCTVYTKAKARSVPHLKRALTLPRGEIERNKTHYHYHFVFLLQRDSFLFELVSSLQNRTSKAGGGLGLVSDKRWFLLLDDRGNRGLQECQTLPAHFGFRGRRESGGLGGSHGVCERDGRRQELPHCWQGGHHQADRSGLLESVLQLCMGVRVTIKEFQWK